MGWKYATTATHPPAPMMANPPFSTPPDVPPPSDFSFSIELLDVYTLETSVTISCSSEELPIRALVKSGCLGNTPTTPSLAISFRTLELFRRIRLRKSSFSVEAFAKVICDMYSVRPCSCDARWHRLTCSFSDAISPTLPFHAWRCVRDLPCNPAVHRETCEPGAWTRCTRLASAARVPPVYLRGMYWYLMYPVSTIELIYVCHAVGGRAKTNLPPDAGS